MSEVHLPAPQPGRPVAWRGRRRGWLRTSRGLAKRRGDPAHPTRIGLWLPLTPLWLILAPFALVFAPLLRLVPPMAPNNQQAVAVRSALVDRPYHTAFALGAVLLALSGTVVEVEAPDAVIRIRIF